MKEGWELKKLGEVCENLDSKRVPITKSKRVSGDIPYYGASGIVDHVADYIFDERLLLVSEDGANLLARTYPIAFSIEGKTWVNNHAHVLKFDNLTTQYFIEYFLNSIKLDRYISGMAQPKLNQKSLNSIIVPFPPLKEQQQIVAILDDAFAAIEQAQANIEKNIDNAKELFQSKLNDIFSQKGEGWEEKAFKDVCVLQRGFDLPKRLRVQGDYPLVSSSGIIDSHVESKVLAPGVVTGRSGSIGNLFYIEEDFWPLNTTLYVKDFKGNLEEYVYYFIKQFDLKRFSSGAGVPTLNRNFVHDEIVFSTNSTKVQKKIVTQLNSLNSQAEQIQAIYKQKLTNLEDLKKSLLEQAFAGKLTCNEPNPTH